MTTVRAVPAPIGLWRAVWLAMRPKTLTASLVPIAVGSVYSAHFLETWSLEVVLLTLASSLAIQIGTNFFNDALDFIKGADTETRLGEARATQSGWMSSKMTGALGILFFLFALLCGIPLVYIGGWPIVAIGLISIVMGYLYTGGPFPLAYVGLGDLFVLIFFGWIAVGGTVLLHSGQVDMASFVLGTQVGLLATALIAINNIRDQKQDALVGKKTFAVRLSGWSRYEVPALYVMFFAANLYWAFRGEWFLFFLVCSLIFPAARLSKDVLNTEPDRIYNQFLARSSLIHLLFAVVFALGVSL
ncbi:MAG TPA: 1,4-dihydroxy-2-naphthoate octaprenyltransferase [Bdellovibrionales bacterium]|nr:1,4-dihydroxy-2-naphthoate octaprenyltransferase [Pseudobdellovibrionaceae bacterium]HAG90347.1 1,4-dihydroxy-2-naphthoate octaprenyltransferase [Bdellovibrionales bacterium]|tara:strand:+ start:246 stop:1151 length:906 start_codon:yes stop_codon:yes gene_type:complete